MGCYTLINDEAVWIDLPGLLFLQKTEKLKSTKIKGYLKYTVETFAIEAVLQNRTQTDVLLRH